MWFVGLYETSKSIRDRGRNSVFCPVGFGVKWTTHLNLIQRWRMLGARPPVSQRLLDTVPY